MFGNHVGDKFFRFGAIYDFEDSGAAEVFKIVGILQHGESTLQERECDLIVDCRLPNRDQFKDVS